MRGVDGADVRSWNVKHDPLTVGRVANREDVSLGVSDQHRSFACRDVDRIERGRTRLAYSVSMDAIQEFQVTTSNYSAEYGRAAGGVVNAVTKSGTNQVHGSAFYFIRDNKWGATNPFQTQVVVENGVQTTVQLKPKDRRQQFGGTVGGPIAPDKLFFFFSYDQQKRLFPGVAKVADATYNTTRQPVPARSQRSPAGCELQRVLEERHKR